MISTSFYDEFLNLTNNEAYTNAFCKRVMLPSSDPLDPYLGNTQRKDFLPVLMELIKNLPAAPHVFDVGGGNGELVDLAFKGNVPEHTSFSVEEPHGQMLEEYTRRLIRAGIRLNEAFNLPVQALFRQKLHKPVDLIISVHMIYHLQSDHDDAVSILAEFVGFLYAQLKSGGVIFLVYADDENGFVGKVSTQYYKDQNNITMANTLSTLYRVRNKLLAEGAIKQQLAEKYPDCSPEISTLFFNSKFYGNTKDDLAAMSLISDIIPLNDDQFDIKKLIYAREFIEVHSSLIGLEKELGIGIRQNMWKVSQPQVACVIKKNPRF